MSPAIKHRHFTAIVKFIMLICLSILTVYALFKGNFIVRGVVCFFVISSGLYYFRRRRNAKATEYDEVGYWSGLDDFELGIDYHCFHDLGLSDDEDFDLFSDDFYDSSPV
ncbi:MAG TPA: hypothetical protein GX501_00125 [Clostridiaceae bacterium]|nr:hypothetical protein [Clostridiaceae bacterium]